MQTKRNILTAMLALGFLAGMGAMPNAAAVPIGSPSCTNALANNDTVPLVAGSPDFAGTLTKQSDRAAFYVAIPPAPHEENLNGWRVSLMSDGTGAFSNMGTITPVGLVFHVYKADQSPGTTFGDCLTGTDYAGAFITDAGLYLVIVDGHTGVFPSGATVAELPYLVATLPAAS